MNISMLFGSLVLLAALSGCAGSQAEFATLPEAEAEGLKVATFAGGCFWCVESDFEKLDGVSEVISGYTGGDFESPTYKQVSSGRTRHVEAVHVFYDPDVVSYRQLVENLWRHTDPTDNGGQFSDRGKEYRTGIFYHNEAQRKIAEASKAELNESGRFPRPVVTELQAFKRFWPAEIYHQDYYKKNPLRYKYYRRGSGRDQFLEKVWGDAPTGQKQSLGQGTEQKRFSRPDEGVLTEKLTPLQYYVTQEWGTEPPFENPYWYEKREGIYVDIVSGEPLFSS